MSKGYLVDMGNISKTITFMGKYQTNTHPWRNSQEWSFRQQIFQSVFCECKKISFVFYWYLPLKLFALPFCQSFHVKMGVYPKHSMYGIFTYIYHKESPNVGKHAIHSVSGYFFCSFFCCRSIFVHHPKNLGFCFICHFLPRWREALFWRFSPWFCGII